MVPRCGPKCLEFLTKMKNGEIPLASIATTIPMKVIVVEFGKVTFEAIADDRPINPLGGVHGGFAATVLDSATGCAVHAALDANIGYATIDLNIKMLKKIPLNFPLIAEGKIINMSKRLGISEATLKDKEGNIYAHATSTCMILPPKKA